MTKRKETIATSQVQGLLRKLVSMKYDNVEFILNNYYPDLEPITLIKQFNAQINVIEEILKDVYIFCISNDGGQLSNSQVNQILDTPQFNAAIQNAQLFMNNLYSRFSPTLRNAISAKAEREQSFKEIIKKVLYNQGGLVRFYQIEETPLIYYYRKLQAMDQSKLQIFCNNELKYLEVAELREVNSILIHQPLLQTEFQSSSYVSNSSPLKKQKTFSTPSKLGVMQNFLSSVIQAIPLYYEQEEVEVITKSFKENYNSILRIINDIEIFCSNCGQAKLDFNQVEQILETPKLKELIDQANEVIKRFPVGVDIRKVVGETLKHGAISANELSVENALFNRIKNNGIIHQPYLDEFIQNNFDLGQTLGSIFLSPEHRLESVSPTSEVSSATSSNSKRDIMMFD